jgi:hypothetical protein
MSCRTDRPTRSKTFNHPLAMPTTLISDLMESTTEETPASVVFPRFAS